MAEYIVKSLDFRGETRKILCPRLANQHSALLALANAILLRGPKNSPVTEEELYSQHLRLKFVRWYQVALRDKKVTVQQMESVFNCLLGPLSISIDPTKCAGIKSNTVGLQIFEHFDMHLYHGLIVNSEDSNTAAGVEETYYDIFNTDDPTALPKFEISDPVILQFSQRTGFTPYGLQNLDKLTENDDIFVLFLNKSFHTVSKHNGSFYILQNDSSSISRDMVWKELNNVDDESKFYSSNFSPVENRPAPPRRIQSYPPATSLPVQRHKCNRRNCSSEFLSVVNFNRHNHVHSKDIKAKMVSDGKVSLMSFWDNLNVEEARKILKIDSMNIEGIGGTQLYASLMKANPRDQLYNNANKMKHVLDGPGNITSEDLFALLDEASEQTAFCSNIDYCPVKSTFKIGLSLLDELINTLACCSFFLEKNLVDAWNHHRTKESSKNADLLLEEEKVRKRILREKRKGRGGRNQPGSPKNIPVAGGDGGLSELPHDTIVQDEDQPVMSPIGGAGDDMGGGENLSGDGGLSELPHNTIVQDEDQPVKSPIGGAGGEMGGGENLSGSKQRMSLEDFLRDNKLTRIYKIRPRKLYKHFKKILEASNRKMAHPLKTVFKLSLNILTYSGRSCARGYLRHIVQNHRAGKCWNGGWTISDMQVDGEFVISKEATLGLTLERVIEDFKKLFELLLEPYYYNETLGSWPLYFDELKTCLMNIPDPVTKFDEFLKYEKYIALHFAVMPPLSRSTLILNLYKAFESARFESDATYQPLREMLMSQNWKIHVRLLPVFCDVYYYHSEPPAEPYGPTCFHLLKYARHFTAHDLDHIKKLVEIEETDLVMTDLVLGQILSNHLSELLSLVVDATNMEGRFLSIFQAYEASDGKLFFCPEDDSDDLSDDDEEESSLS